MRNLTASIVQVFSGLRFRLMLLILLACAPLMALVLHSSWEDRRRAEAGWRNQSEELQRIARRDEEELIGGAHQLLLAISESSYVRSFNPRRCKKALDELF